MQVRLQGDGSLSRGGAPIIMHNERLADPLDSFTRALAEVTAKRRKVIEDHAEIARREFFGGLYTDPVIEWPPPFEETVPAIPAWNVLRCLQEGAKRNRRGPDVLRGCSPLAEFATFTYDGPADPEELWKTGTYTLRKSVGVQRSRTMRTRPIFRDWKVELLIEVDLQVWDVATLGQYWREAGLYAGLGDMRPVYGKFAGTYEEVGATTLPAAKPARKKAA